MERLVLSFMGHLWVQQRAYIYGVHNLPIVCFTDFVRGGRVLGQSQSMQSEQLLSSITTLVLSGLPVLVSPSLRCASRSISLHTPKSHVGVMWWALYGPKAVQ